MLKVNSLPIMFNHPLSIPLYVYTLLNVFTLEMNLIKKLHNFMAMYYLPGNLGEITNSL